MEILRPLTRRYPFIQGMRQSGDTPTPPDLIGVSQLLGQFNLAAELRGEIELNKGLRGDITTVNLRGSV